MALEDLITKLTASIDKQNGLLEKMMAGAKPAATSPGTAPKATTGTAPKPSGTKPKEISVEELGAKATEYVKGHDDRDAAKANIVRISEKFGAERFTAIDAANRKEALELLAQFVAGEDPFGDAEGGEDEDSPI